jgi:hypothetical protein
LEAWLLGDDPVAVFLDLAPPLQPLALHPPGTSGSSSAAASHPSPLVCKVSQLRVRAVLVLARSEAAALSALPPKEALAGSRKATGTQLSLAVLPPTSPFTPPLRMASSPESWWQSSRGEGALVWPLSSSTDPRCQAFDLALSRTTTTEIEIQSTQLCSAVALVLRRVQRLCDLVPQGTHPLPSFPHLSSIASSLA